MMDQYQQIKQLAGAAEQIYQLIPHVDPKHSASLLAIADSIADLADEIEGEE